MNNSLSVPRKQTPDVGTRIMFDGLQLVVLARDSIRGAEASCEQCWGSRIAARICSQLPACGNAGDGDARLFVPDTEHEPTANRIALMKLRGEL